MHQRQVVFAWLRFALGSVVGLVAIEPEDLDLEGLVEVFGKPSWMFLKKRCDVDWVTPDLCISFEADLFTLEIIRSHVKCGW